MSGLNYNFAAGWDLRPRKKRKVTTRSNATQEVRKKLRYTINFSKPSQAYITRIYIQKTNCSIPNRTIFNKLFLVKDLIKYTKKKNFYSLQIVQEKAFDKIDRTFL